MAGLSLRPRVTDARGDMSGGGVRRKLGGAKRRSSIGTGMREGTVLICSTAIWVVHLLGDRDWA